MLVKLKEKKRGSDIFYGLLALPMSSHSVLFEITIFLRIMLNVGHHCGPTYYSHLHFTHRGLAQCLSFVYSLKQQWCIQKYRESAGLFYHLFIFSRTVASATNTGMLGSEYTVALRHFLYKDCFFLNCEKLLLVRKEKSLPPSS